MVDVSKEKQYLLYGIVLSLLGGIPYIGAIFAIIAIIMYYMAFSGYEQKLGLDKPKKYYLYSIVIGIIGTLIVLGIIFSGSFTNHVENGAASFTNTGDYSSIIEVILPALILFWLVMLAGTYYSTLAFAELAKYFKIDDFITYRKIALISVGGFPLWIVIPLIGWLIFIGLALAALVYVIKGITKLPETYEPAPAQ